jgi:hypothetical protein
VRLSQKNGVPTSVSASSRWVGDVYRDKSFAMQQFESKTEVVTALGRKHTPYKLESTTSIRAANEE